MKRGRRPAVRITLATTVALASGYLVVWTLLRPSWSPAISEGLAALCALVLVGACAASLVMLRQPGEAAPSTQWVQQEGGQGLIHITASEAGATPGRSGPAGLDRSRIASAATVLVALGGLVYPGLELHATLDQNAVAEQSQISGRLTTAINQISTPGTEYLETRLGGIDALKRLATDSPSDQPGIIDELSAFVRSNAPLPKKEETCPNNVTPDVQAALTVLGQRNLAHDGGATIDLHATCLDNVDLIGAQFDNANLTLTNFFDAHLNNAHLVGARFTDGSLYATDLSGAYLGSDDLTDVTTCKTNIAKIHIAAGFKILPPQARCR